VPPPSNPSSALQDPLGTILERFESLWLRGQRPALDDFLPPAGPQRTQALVELAHIDLELRLKAGEVARVEDYLHCYPELTANPKVVLDLIGAELAQRRHEPGFDANQYRQRFPELADLLPQPAAAIDEPHQSEDSEPTHATPPSVLTRHGAAGTAKVPSPPPFVPGYEILDELGRGGMGVVYKASQTKLNRLVALKMILAGVHAGPQHRLRFQAEAEAVARLRHPNLVQIYEVGEAGGCPFFSLEYVAGGTLDRRMAGTPQPPRVGAELVATLAQAMHHAHLCGVVHRDLKPGNILLQISDLRLQIADLKSAILDLQSEIPKITDFGLAKLLDTEGELSKTGAIMGTPSYMAPEQAEGRVHEIGPAADVYSLAAILYELLTGRPPFKGTSVLDTLEQVRTREPLPPTRFQIKIPRDLETVCLKGLRKDYRQRYASAQEFADDLNRFLEGRPVLARPVPAWERAWKWARRRPAQAALAGALMLAVLGGGLFYGLYQQQRAATLTAQTQRQREIRGKVDQLWSTAQAAENSGRLADARAAWDQALATLDLDPQAGGPELRERLVEGRQRTQQQLEEQQQREQREAGRRAFRERLERFGQGRDQVLFHAVSFRDDDAAADAAIVRREAPRALHELGLDVGERPEDMATSLHRFRPVADSASQLDRVAAECDQVLLAWAAAEVGPGTEAKAGARQALHVLDAAEALGTAHRLKPPRTYHVRRARGLELLGEGEAARAERKRAAAVTATAPLDLLEGAMEAYHQGDVGQALALCEGIPGQDALAFWAQYIKALCQLRQKQWLASRFGFDRCLDRRPDSPWLLMHRAVARIELHEYAGAEADFTAALAAADPASRALVLTNRSVLRIRQKRWDDAERDLREAIHLDPGAYQGMVNLARAYQAQHKLDAALATLDEAVKMRPNEPALYYTRARLQVERGDRAAARRDFEQTITTEGPGSASDRSQAARVELAHLEYKDGQYEAALATCDAALKLRPRYAPAHRERGETLLALSRYREAGQALDACLEVESPRTPEVLLARGLVHLRLGEPERAVESFNRAIELRRDADGLAYRGWAYLEQQAARPALADFDAALKLQADNLDALSGRGLARALLGQTTAAIDDAEKALHKGPATARVYFRCAAVYARCLRSAAHGQAYRYQERALDLLRNALEMLPPAERPTHWRRDCQNNPDLASLRRSSGWLELARQYAR
jgi:tetratricopeptide (TPR) repeat protein